VLCIAHLSEHVLSPHGFEWRRILYVADNGDGASADPHVLASDGRSLARMPPAARGERA
jgi:hypothetical protein